MSTLRTIGVGLIAACLGAFACGSSGSGRDAGGGGGSSGSSSGGGTGGTGCTWNACGLLTQQTASQAVQSTSLSAGTEMDSPGMGGGPGTFSCEYATPDTSTLVSMSINCNVGNIVNSASSDMALAQALGNHITPVTLAKVDDAFWVTSPSDAGPPPVGGILLVNFGGHSYFTITLFLPRNTTVNGQDAATQMATAVIAGLNL